MKKTLFFVLLGAFTLTACQGLFPEQPSKDAKLSGQQVDVSELPASVSKVFVLNEGGMGSNNSTLDFLRVSDGKYVTGAFKQMNPDVGAGLGDVGNDIAVNGDEVWIVVNNSGLVEVLSAKDETEIAAISVPTPRSIAFDNQYAYVTSWAGAYASGTYDSNGVYSLTDYKNPKGQVYRINLRTKKVEGSVEVGYQPEGIAYYDGKLYVANSGGISSQLPPVYAYDNTLSIVDTKTFTLVQTVVVEVNLKNVYSDGKGAIYVTTLGNYWNVHSGLYVLMADKPEVSARVGGQLFTEDALHVTCSAIAGNTVFCIGTENEFDWTTPHTYYIWYVSIEDYATGKATLSFPTLASFSGTPYGMSVLEDPSASGEIESDYFILVGDAGDYFNPGTVSLYDLSVSKKLWDVSAGVCPGHFAIY